MHARIALVVFIALAVLAIDPVLLKFAFADRQEMHRLFTTYPDRGWDDYPRFLDDVRAHTGPGDSIALLVPQMRWDDGYSYAYYRASYFLSGREVLPLAMQDGKPLAQNFARAKYIASWRRNVIDATRRVVWSGDHGTLLER